jgi:hypothetical protein
MPRGGKRTGAGRPSGSKDVLPRGSIPAIRSLTIAPKGVRAKGLELSEEEQAIADRAFQRIVDVMDGRVHPSEMPSVLKASTEVRSEVLGERTKKLDVKASLEQLIAETGAEDRDDPDR